MIERAVPGAAASRATGGDAPTPSDASLAATPPTLKYPAPDIHSVDIDTLALTQPHSVGVDHVALHAKAQLGLAEKLATVGVPAVVRACILGNLLGRSRLGCCHLGVATC